MEPINPKERKTTFTQKLVSAWRAFQVTFIAWFIYENYTYFIDAFLRLVPATSDQGLFSSLKELIIFFFTAAWRIIAFVGLVFSSLTAGCQYLIDGCLSKVTSVFRFVGPLLATGYDGLVFCIGKMLFFLGFLYGKLCIYALYDVVQDRIPRDHRFSSNGNVRSSPELVQ
ncbi:hypothetical protein GGR54DRAFT_651450 [Hypoxylon sp. NC1633]|nr:hypothetical protein GGR54DRAFT_651450 [Hypoxylon sp. NC1633]